MAFTRNRTGNTNTRRDSKPTVTTEALTLINRTEGEESLLKLKYFQNNLMVEMQQPIEGSEELKFDWENSSKIFLGGHNLQKLVYSLDKVLDGEKENVLIVGKYDEATKTSIALKFSNGEEYDMNPFIALEVINEDYVAVEQYIYEFLPMEIPFDHNPEDGSTNVESINIELIQFLHVVKEALTNSYSLNIHASKVAVTEVGTTINSNTSGNTNTRTRTSGVKTRSGATSRSNNRLQDEESANEVAEDRVNKPATKSRPKGLNRPKTMDIDEADYSAIEEMIGE